MHLHTNTHQYTHRHQQTHTHEYTDTCIFLYFFPLVAGDKLGNELQFFNLFAATGRKQFCGRPLPGPAELLSPFPTHYPRDCYSELKANPNPNPLPSQSVSFSQCHRAVKSSQRSLSENFLITTSRSLRVLLHSFLHLFPSTSPFLTCLWKNFFYEKYGNYAQLAASQIRIPKTLQCHFWSPRINCITNYASKAKKLNTFCGRRKRERGEGAVFWTVFGKQLFVYSTQFCIVLELVQLDLQVSKV